MDATLDRLLEELGEECQMTLSLLAQFQQSKSEGDRASILAELLAFAIHLNAHCDEAFLEACDRLSLS